MRILALCFALPLLAHWPGFRGPSRQGVAPAPLPVTWDDKDVAWRTPIPGEGWSSPIIWENRVFLTSATDGGASCHLLSLDRATGKILWDREVFRQEIKRKEGKNSYATPTPVTDGKKVYAVFGSGGIAAVDFAGKVLWTNLDFPHYSQHGLGASPVLHENLLIMPRDGSSESGDLKVGWQKPWDQSYLLALDKRTGKLRWKGKRGLSRIAHVSPNIARVGGKWQIVSGAGDVVQGFDAQTGELVWTARSQGEGVVPSIVIGQGLAFSASGFEKPTIRAVRLGGGKGDVTATHLAWEQTKGVPMISSMVYVAPHLYSVTTAGVAFCLNAATGEVVWQGRVGGNHSASPIASGRLLYFLSEEGEVTVLEAGPEFKVLGKSKLDGRIQASPAALPGWLYVRTDKELIAIPAAPARK
ncbi:MAG: PQQ-binding-like beta-propeller repeat protein [Bryobacteraceae bacterium]|nr:PQQ-binding-like beta-propeller repeat protein [Bryobacteraceae bacterium]